MALLEWQALQSATERLDLGFFVHAEHEGMGRWRDVEPDEFVQPLHEGGIVGALEAAPATGREAVRFPDLPHRRDRNAARPGHGQPRPVGRFVRRRPLRHRGDGGAAISRDRRHDGGTHSVMQQPVDPLLQDPRARQSVFSVVPVIAMVAPAATLSALGSTIRARQTWSWRIAVSCDALEPASVGGARRDGCSDAHAADSDARRVKGILIKDSSVSANPPGSGPIKGVPIDCRLCFKLPNFGRFSTFDHHCWLTEAQFSRLQPFLPNRSRSVPRAAGRWLISGISISSGKG